MAGIQTGNPAAKFIDNFAGGIDVEEDFVKEMFTKKRKMYTLLIRMVNPMLLDNSSEERQLINALKENLKNSSQSKFAVGYFFLSGFNLVKEDFPSDKNHQLKIVMGRETTKPTAEEISIGYKLRKNTIENEFFNQLNIVEKDEIKRIKELRDLIKEGKMIEQFTHTFDKPRYWVEECKGAAKLGNRDYKEYRLGFRSVASSTNRRTLITTILPKNVFCGNSLIISKIYENGKRLISEKELVFLCAVFNSFVLDYMFFIYELPNPRLTEGNKEFDKIVELAGKLICIGPEFDELKERLGVESGVQDKKDRIKIQAELDILISRLYGITPEELKHIIAQFDVKNPEAKEELGQLKGAILELITKNNKNPEGTEGG